MVALFAAPIQAQEADRQFNRELHFGTTLGNGFNPRLIYKNVKEKSVARYLLKFNSGTSSSTRNLGENPLYSSEIAKASNLDIAIGIGREWRTDIQNRLQVYGGGDIEAIFSLSSTTRRKSQAMPNGPARDGENISITAQSPGLALHAFGGIRFAINDRVSLSAEAGPRITGQLRFEKNESIYVNNAGLPDEEIRRDESTANVFNLDFKAIGPLYVQFAIHF